MRLSSASCNSNRSSQFRTFARTAIVRPSPRGVISPVLKNRACSGARTGARWPLTRRPRQPASTSRPGSPEARLSLLDRSDVLIVTPASTSATRLLVERARRAGVPIIAESISYPGAIAVVAIDDYRAGVELAHWVGSYAQRHMADEVRALDLTTSLPNTRRAQPRFRRRPAPGAPQRADPVERGWGRVAGSGPPDGDRRVGGAPGDQRHLCDQRRLGAGGFGRLSCRGPR